MKKNLSLSTLSFVLLFSLMFGCKKENNENIVTDIDGNVYHTVTIGSQVWMVENLKTTRYRDGSPIANVRNSSPSFLSCVPGTCANYNMDQSKLTSCGRLYNGIAACGDIAPAGWHVPSDSEWSTLINYLGGENVAGDKLKETSPVQWGIVATATNESGFSALPGGYYDGRGNYKLVGSNGLWWSSTAFDYKSVRSLRMNSDNGKVERTQNDVFEGLSIRCIKD